MAQQAPRAPGIVALAHVAFAGALIGLALRLGIQLAVPLVFVAVVVIMTGAIGSQTEGYARTTTVPMLAGAAVLVLTTILVR